MQRGKGREGKGRGSSSSSSRSSPGCTTAEELEKDAKGLAKMV